MLEAYIIEELRRRHDERLREQRQPQLELPLPPHRPPEPRTDDRSDEPDRDGGVVTINT